VASANYQFVWHEFCDWYLEWIKADLFSQDVQAQQQAKAVLLTVLEQVLKLMHPITPFVTEEIWGQLPGNRSSIMVEPFPEPMASWVDTEAEGVMNLLMGIISGLRTIRTEAEVHPSAKIEATLICPDTAKRLLLTTYAPGIQAMVKANLQIEAAGIVPDDAVHALVQDVELVVPLKGLIDVAGELEKLAKEQARLEKELERIAGKLANEKFMSNAPEAVVAKERDKAAEFQAHLAKTIESTERLRKLC